MTAPADDVTQQAAEWLALMAVGEPAAADRERFRQWHAADPAHARAYAELRRLWEGAGALPARASSSRPAALSRRRVLQGGIAAGVAALIGGSWMVAEHSFADYQTGTGERRAIRLPDGSQVEMSAATALSLHLGAGERRVQLHHGEAFFTVAGDPERPFRVVAGGGTVTALGTAFGVALGNRQTSVVVTEHAVSVDIAGRTLTVREGEGIRFGEDGLPVPAVLDPAVALSWRQGRLAFLSAPLSEVIEAISRWRTGRVILMDRALETRPVTVILDVTRADSMLETLSRVLPVRLVSITPYLTIIRPA